MNWIMIVVGVLLMAAGVIWTLQGLNLLPGSAMSGVLLWVVVGPVVEVVGLLLVVIGIARLRRS
ncbi:hypothetical protein FLP10_10315 [Agromyces intestinalis]|uniref:Uncharacterized protein n=1 Tax=Agromyces intestinalis TaxID=2592652 RepID=A0A5C1YGM3_9MICO|nr:hypothetical protein [Agromyces intestinalis]QEO14758.1 hypothetical protein FLP10_10315 [Agromyces intestinalis]